MNFFLRFRLLMISAALAFASINASKAQTNNQQPANLWDKDKNKNIYEDPTYNNVGIGTITPSEKLHVSGNIKVQGKIIADSMRVIRIIAMNDSTVHFGDHSIGINTATNVISWTPTRGGCGLFVGYNGLAIANGTSFAKGSNSMVFGNNVNVPDICPS
jgi:hypothetical protein